jgi:ribosome-binding protein aMBF1 (putative translation factor)
VDYSSPEKMVVKFSDICRVGRQEKKISARELSLMIGASGSYISKVESGAISPTIENAAKIMCALDFTNQEIIYTIRWLSQ